MEMAQEAITRFLMRRGSRGALQSEIHEVTGFSKSTVSYFLSKLEAEGKITRRRESNLGYRVWLKGFESSGKLIKVGIVRATEYPFIFELSSKLENEGFSVYVRAYDNGIALMSDLVSCRVDAGFSPLITQLMFYAVSQGCFKIVPMGVSGGGSIMLRANVNLSDVKRAGSTMASTMDACLRAYLRDQGMDDVDVIYFNSPVSMMEALDRGDVQMLSIWEPYSSILRAKGHERVAKFTDYLGDFPCCLLAVKPIDNIYDSIIDATREVLSRSNYSAEVAKLSNMLNVDRKLVERSIREYVFYPEFKSKDIEKYLKNVGLELPISWVTRSSK